MLYRTYNNILSSVHDTKKYFQKKGKKIKSLQSDKLQA